MKKMSVHNLTLAALFVAITAVLSQIVVPMPLVPFNLGVLALFLCGGMLPRGTAFLSLLCYIILGGIGVPVFAQFSGGPAVLFGVTGGYLMAYPITAWLTAWLIEIWAKRSYWKRLAAMAIALIPVYLFGTAWFAIYLHKSFAAAAMAGCVPFIPFDLAKGALAAYVTLAVSRRVPAAAV